ncbi:MAG: LEA type 2 family protein [Tannerellaceae bacterium]|nr:LEA type 2 family protein [Tannerellaceae bacterium]
MRAKSFILFLLISFFILQGCGTSKQEDYSNLVTCTYAARSLSKPTLAGKDLSKGINFVVVSDVAAILAGNTSSVPFDFTVNINVRNPNQRKMIVNEIEYILRVDNIHLASGTYTKPLTIQGGKTKQLPLEVSIELVNLLRSNSAGTVQNMVKNLMGSGNRRSNVTLQIKPSYRVGKEIIESPRTIPLSFSFGG